MSGQLSLDMTQSTRRGRTRLPAGTNQLSLDEQFDVWIGSNPKIWALFEKYAMDLARRGFQHYGAKAVVERMRWHLNIELPVGEEFVMNNNYTSRLARRFVELHPEHGSLFRMRELRS